MSPKTPTQVKAAREKMRYLIMNVALEHFANNGYHHTSISQIAKTAGISKGLLYNYFENKENLLTEIIDRSMSDFSSHFTPGDDSHLTEQDFELFIRKFFLILREKIEFWRMFFQLIVQKDVREQFLKPYLDPVNSVQSVYVNGNNTLLALISKMLADYFIRKKERKPADYDPTLDMNMFIYTIEGFARITAYLDEIDENYYDKTVNRIIELYK
jgi:AcrR family transcriptional regulator